MRKYKLWRPEYSETEDDGREVMGINPQDAVEQWAERDDARSADYTIVGGTPASVMVRNVQTGVTEEWIVSGESVPLYRARLKEQR